MEEERSETSPNPRPRRANDIDITGQTVAANVARLRNELRLTTEQLAERLTNMGRPMRATTITKIENRQRRVDADDLVALALALGVNVSALLLPPTARGTGEVTGIDHPVSAFHLWTWASGEGPLPPDDDPSVDPEQVARLKSDDLGFWADYWNERMQRWDKECRPHHRIDRARDWARHHEALSNATKAAQVAVDAGMSIPAVLDWLMESLRQYALFENVKTGERVLRTVGDSEYNRMSASDEWRQLPEDEVQTVINKRRSKG